LKTEVKLIEEKSFMEFSRAKVIRNLSRKLPNLHSPNTILKFLLTLLKDHYSFEFIFLSDPNKRPGLLIQPKKLVFSSKDISEFHNDLKSQKIDDDVSYHRFGEQDNSDFTLGGISIREMLISRIETKHIPHRFFGMIRFDEALALKKADLDFFQTISSMLSLKFANIELEKSVKRAETQIVDDSQRLHRENEQRSELLKKIKLQTQELRLKSQEVEEFVYSASHDLKTPVISILGFIETLKTDSKTILTPESSFYLKRMESNTLHVIAMIDEILEYSRIGRFSQEKTIVNLSTIINESLLRFSQEIKKKKIRVELDAEFPDVEVELNRMVQLFDNLLGNCIKFMGNQSSPSIKVGISNRDSEYVKIYVEDNGIGIPEGSLGKVFNLFSRASNVDENIEGTGIGLAQVKKIVEIHNGKIWLESKEGEGTTISFTLPLIRQKGTT
jgi:signal transduction histidine kinase